MKVLISDNNDSFTTNLEHLIAQSLKVPPVILPYADLGLVNPDEYDLLVISAGPGHPSEYTKYARLLDSGMPILGICLGIQIINEHFGGTTSRLEGCVHGRTDTIEFDVKSFEVATYNSLRVDRIGFDLDVIAANREGVPMALRHRNRRIIGYQFHPESFLTSDGGYFIDYAIKTIEANRPSALLSGSM